jgi:hypothetical protein
MNVFSKQQIIEIIKPFLGQIDANNLIDYNFIKDTLTLKIRSRDNVFRIYTICLFFKGEAANEEAGDFNLKSYSE